MDKLESLIPILLRKKKESHDGGSCLKAQNSLVFSPKNGEKVVPVEVKAGVTGSLKSLQVFVAEKKMPFALRFNAMFNRLR